MHDPRDISRLRKLLPHTWHAFLGRFGTPTPVQLQAIPAILSGRPTLLVAPTAGGKTEAFAAPMAESILAGPEPRCLRAWVVCPTRALVNDLARRLEAPLKTLGLRLGRRTGEHREIPATNPPHVVLTTPESLDSLLTRSPKIFDRMRHLVLDEVHMLDTSPRGDQLACLVSRAKRIAKDLQVVASSATVDDPDGLGRRYLGADSVKVCIPGLRPIEPVFASGSAAALNKALLDIVKGGAGVRKVLAFVNRRSDAERLCSIFKGRPPFGESVFLHHGSLARSAREAVEKRMLSGQASMCFATTTLEVGIDIGDVDLVVLTAPPADVTSLLQRIGRGSRRTALARVLCLAADEGQDLRYRHLLHAARAGRLLADPHRFHPSVLVQQCLSLLLQTPGKWIDAKALASRLPGWISEGPWIDRLPGLLVHLSDRGWLLPAGGRFRVGDRLEEAFERGRIHANIADQACQLQVVDMETRKVLGVLPRGAASGGKFLLGGRKLKVKSLQQDRILVTDTAGPADFKVWGAAGPTTSRRLSEDFAAFAGIEPGRAPVVQLPDGRPAVFHFLGSAWSALLNALLEDLPGPKSQQSNPFCTVVEGAQPVLPRNLEPETVKATITRHANRLSQRIPLGPWSREMPPSWRSENLLQILNPEFFTETLCKLTECHEPVPEEHQKAFTCLAVCKW